MLHHGTYLILTYILDLLPNPLLLSTLSKKECSEFFPVLIGVWLDTTLVTQYNGPMFEGIDDPKSFTDIKEKEACVEEILALVLGPWIMEKSQLILQRHQ